MNVFVAGATGVLGRPVVRLLTTANHRVRAVARSGAKAAALERLGAEATRCDLFDAGGLRRAVEGCSAVLHLATHIPPPSQGRRRSAWVENDRLRRDATRLLVDAARDAGAEVYVQESVTFLYRDGGDRWLDEESPLDVTTLLESALDAERETARFTAAGGRGVVLRFAAFYGPEASSTQTTLQLARYGLFPVFGGGESYFSSIHVDDAARAVVAALAAAPGTYNVTDDVPVLMRDYIEALCSAFAFRRPWRLPRSFARLLLGSNAETLLRSQRVANARFKAATGWTPHFPSVREGWNAMAKAAGGSP